MLQGLRIHIKIMEAMGTTLDTKNISAKEEAVSNAEEISKAAVVAVSTGI